MSDCAPILDDPEPAPPEPIWLRRWGAIAIGDTSTGGGVGVSTYYKNRSGAQRAAIKQCAARGGGETCRSKVFAYHDQCVALAWGTGGYEISSAETLGQATANAMRYCTGRTEACQIYYSGCSLPVQRQ